MDVDQPTSLAVTSFRGPEPEFHFYGQPPSYGQFAPAHLDPATVAGAATLYCGSIALLCDASRAAARRAWSEPGPLKTLDPNVRASLTPDPAGLRSTVEEFAATADLVKLSEPDARALFDADPADAATHLRSLGAAAVVVTRGAAGALLVTGSGEAEIAAPPTDAVDTTGAGDAVMAGLLHGLLITGPRPTGRTGRPWSGSRSRSPRCAASAGAAPPPCRPSPRSVPAWPASRPRSNPEGRLT